MNLKKELSQKLEAIYGINEDVTIALIDDGVIDEGAARNFLIQKEYHEKCEIYKKTDLKIQLSEKFSCSFSTVEKIILKKIE